METFCNGLKREFLKKFQWVTLGKKNLFVQSLFEHLLYLPSNKNDVEVIEKNDLTQEIVAHYSDRTLRIIVIWKKGFDKYTLTDVQISLEPRP